jgi:flagellar motor protein MotB
LIAQFGMTAERLAAKGYGKSQLLDPANPEDGVNRRVQIINVTAAGQRN